MSDSYGLNSDKVADPPTIRVGVTNAVLSNTGDAAIFEAILTSLERQMPGRCQVVVFDSNARVTARLYPRWRIHQQLSVSPPREPARVRSVLQRVRHSIVKKVTSTPAFTRFFRLPPLNRTRFAKSLLAFLDLDVLISSGGTYLVDHYNFESRAVELELARSRGIPVVLWTQSMGPFKSDRASSQISRVAGAVRAVFFRDPRSRAAWDRRIERPEIASAVVPDSVFAMQPATPSRGGRRAVISVREWSRGVDESSFDNAAYDASMRAAAESLAKHGWDVRALSTCQGVPSYSYDDSAEARRILMGTPAQIDRAFHSPTALLDELTDTGLVVTTRMHLGILALISRVPVIAIAYEFKTVELFESLGLADFVVKIEDVNPAWIESRIQLLQESPDLARLTPEKLSELRALADSPAATVRDIVSGS